MGTTLKVVQFGTFSTAEGYPRNHVIASALASAGAEVLQCHAEAWGPASARASEAAIGFRTMARAVRIAIAWLRLAWRYLCCTPRHDVVLVGYPGFLDVHLAFVLSRLRGRPLIVLDTFLGLHEAIVDDRRLVAPGSWRARLLGIADAAACRVADIALLDTQTHIDHHASFTGVDPAKFLRTFVGSDPRLQFSSHGIPRPGNIVFFGAFLRLHGIDVIIRAASILRAHKHICFTLIGDGPERMSCLALAQELGGNVRWVPGFLGYTELAAEIGAAEACLGIFSDTAKAQRVIPCKVFNIIAAGKPLITADTPAARELLTHEENALLIPPADPEALSRAILRVTTDQVLRERIAAGGRTLFEGHLTAHAMGVRLVAQLQQVLENKAAGVHQQESGSIES